MLHCRHPALVSTRASLEFVSIIKIFCLTNSSEKEQCKNIKIKLESIDQTGLQDEEHVLIRMSLHKRFSMKKI